VYSLWPNETEAGKSLCMGITGGLPTVDEVCRSESRWSQQDFREGTSRS
jgi:hypothetical protein